MLNTNVSFKRDTKVLFKSLYIQMSSQKRPWINNTWSYQLILAWLNWKYSREQSYGVTLKSMRLLGWKTRNKKKLALFFSSLGFVQHDGRSLENGLSPLILHCLNHSLNERKIAVLKSGLQLKVRMKTTLR